jgi:hypothetical protein
MKKITKAGAVLALAAGALFAFAPVASAEECGQPAVYETVTTEATPAVYGPDVKVIDVEAKEAVPAVEEVSHIEHRLVTPAVPGKDAYDEVVTPSQWWNWSPNNSQGPQDYEPAFPVDERGTWQGPHTDGGPDGEGTFNVSHGNSGNSSWFHREPAVVIHHDAVPEIPAVYKDVTVIDVVGVPGTPAVEEVSHLEKGPLLTPATEATSKQVLVTPATKACPETTVVTTRKPPAATPTVDNPPAELAFTGSQTQDTSLLAAAALLGAFGAYRLRRRLA